MLNYRCLVSKSIQCRAFGALTSHWNKKCDSNGHQNEWNLHYLPLRDLICRKQYTRWCADSFIHEGMKNYIKISSRNFSISSLHFKFKKVRESSINVKEETKIEPERVRVFDSSDKFVDSMTLDEANKIAKKDDLKLVNIGEANDKVQCYKMVTGKQMFEEGLRGNNEKKSPAHKKEKEFKIKSNIDERDLSIKLNKIKDLINKGVHVKIIALDQRKASEEENNKNQAALFRNISSNLEDCASVKKSSKKPTSLVVNLQPKNL